MSDKRRNIDQSYGGDVLLNGSTEKDNQFNEDLTRMELNESRVQKNSTCERWRQILFEYTQTTTLHGLVQVTSPQPFWIRRIIWLLLFLGGCVLFAIQVVTSVMYFISWPVAVDVKINYNDTILFPAVTICNHNAFRTTEAYGRDEYYLINDLFAGHTTDRYNTTRVTLKDLYLQNGHALKDLVVSCTWDGRDCDTTNFEPTLTDFGLCYTFNHGTDDNPLFHATQTGSEGGLRLQLNIEQYEYMRGPNPGAGLKLHIHNQYDVPLVKDHGLAVPPGSHGFVAIKTVEVNNLKYPHGKCNDSVELDYFDTYTMSSCYLNCKQRYLIEKCACRDVYMADDPFENAPICTVEQYQRCMLRVLEEFLRIKDSCDCPIPCHRRMYDPTMSYASTSNFDIDTLLRQNNTLVLKDKYLKAREVQQRVKEGIIATDTELIMSLNQTVQNLSAAFMNLSTSLNSASQVLSNLYSDIEKRIAFHLDRGLDGVKYTVEHSFIRPWDVFEERAFDFVTADFFDVATSVKRTLASYSTDVSDSPETRNLLYIPNKSTLDGRIELIMRAEEYLNITSHAYRTGEAWLMFKNTIDRRYDLSYVSLDVIQSGIGDEKEHYDALIETGTWFKDGIEMLKQVGDQFVQTGIFNETLYIAGEQFFYKACRRYNYRLFMYEERVVEKPLGVIEERIENFERANRTLHSAYMTVGRKINDCKTLISQMNNSLISDIMNLSHNASEYLVDLSKQKAPLCHAAMKMDDIVRLLTLSFGEIRSMIQSLDDILYELKEAFIAVWQSMLNEVSTQTFYEQMYNDSLVFLEDENEYETFIRIFADMLRTDEDELRTHTRSEIVEMVNGDFYIIELEDKINDLRDIFINLTTDIDIARKVGDKDEQLLAAFDNLRLSFQNFLSGNEIDTNFYRENFMRLDVFMQELSYEEITQQKAYDIARLLSDIGGSMGLFIGGSVLSIFEFFDVFLHHGARLALGR